MTQKAPPGSCGFAPTLLMLSSHRNRTPKRRYRLPTEVILCPQLTHHLCTNFNYRSHSFHAIGVWITATPRGGNEDSKIHLTTGYGTAHSIG